MVNKRNLKAVYRAIIDKKGFTMVELIVVLVILAILAAAAVPALLGYIDTAREKRYIAEGKEALAAAQSMMNDVYTDNLANVTVKMRDEAFKTSGLEDNTAFAINTVRNFRDDADGTSATIACYTIASALYTAEDGTFIYYDGSNWTKKEKDDSEVKGIKDVNFIWVWGYEPHEIDTGFKTIEVIDSGEGEEDVIDNGDDSEIIDSTEARIDIVVDNAEVNVILIAADPEYGHQSMTLAGGFSSIELTYDSSLGFETDPRPQATPFFEQSSILWSSTDNIPAGATPVSDISMSELKEYLSANLDEYKDKTFEFKATISEREVKVPVTFCAYISDDNIDPKLKVEVIGDDSYDKNEDGINDTEIMSYGVASNTLRWDSSDFDLTHINVSSNVSAPNTSVASHDGNWVRKIGPNEYQKNAENSYKWINTSDGFVTNVSDWISLILSNNDIEDAITEISNGVTFVAPADIHKTLYVRGTLTKGTNPDFTHMVWFSENDQGEPLEYSFSINFRQNELTKVMFDEDDVSAPIQITESYSIFGSNGRNVYTDNLRLKWWYIYATDDKNINIKDNTFTPNENNRKRLSMADEKFELSNYLIEELYADSEKYGELAELDVAAFSTKLNSDASEGNDTVIHNRFKELAGNDYSKIKNIFWTNADNPDNYSSKVKEICISTTTIKSDPKTNFLKRNDNGEYEIEQRKEDFPAYTVAYSVPNNDGGTSGFNIYVFTEDGSDMKAVGSYKSLCQDYKNMMQNTFVSHLDTAEVNDMQNMFSGCNSLSSLNLLNFNTSIVKNMSYMFRNCGTMESLDITGFNTRNVTAMVNMFEGCSNLSFSDMKSAAPSNPNGVNCTAMFKGCTGIIIVDDYDFTYINNMKNMFENCSSLTDVTISGRKGEDDTNAPCTVTDGNVKDIFKSCNVKNIIIKDIEFSGFTASGKNTSGLRDIVNSSFGTLETFKMENVSLPKLETLEALMCSKVNDNAADGMPNLRSVEIIDVDAPKLSRLKTTFQKNKNLESVKFRNFNIIPTKDTSNKGWNRNISQMFANCESLVNVDFGSYGEEGAFTASTMSDFDDMFYNCTSLEVLDLSAFNLERNMPSAKTMFANCINLTTIYATNPDTHEGYGFRFNKVDNAGEKSSIGNEKGIFYGCVKLTGGNGTVYNDSTDIGKGIKCNRARVDTAGEDGYFTEKDPTPKAMLVIGSRINDAFANLAGVGTNNKQNVTNIVRSATSPEELGLAEISLNDATRGNTSPEWAENNCSGKYCNISLSESVEKYPTPVYAWGENGTVYWYSEEEHPLLSVTCRSMFAYFTIPNTYGIKDFDARFVEDMSYMFADRPDDNYSGRSGLTTVNLDWDTSNVKSMEGLFKGRNQNADFTWTNFDTSNVTTLRKAFDGVPLNDVSFLYGLDMSKVTNMDFAFDSVTVTSLTVDGREYTSNIDVAKCIIESWNSLDALDDALDGNLSNQTFRNWAKAGVKNTDYTLKNGKIWHINGNGNFGPKDL